MQEAYVDICGIPTHIITWGRWIEASLNDISEIVICITGNPGLPGFYTEFLELLHRNLSTNIPVWVIGHLGHDDSPSKGHQVIQLKGNENSYDLKAQIYHKIEFIRKYVPHNIKIHLIGHSIGAWMILQLLEDESIRTQIRKCYLLFPTIERMVETSNGRIFTKIALPLYSIFGFVVNVFNWLPLAVRTYLIQLYFWLNSIPNQFLNAALMYSKASVVEKVMFLAEDEMSCVNELQENIIRKNKDLLILYYGTTDGWVPVRYYKELLQKFPDLDAQLDTKQIDHAFVLKNSTTMAQVTGDMISRNSQFVHL